MSETLHDRQRRWAESLPLLSNELTELACVLADEEPRKIGVHLLWPLFVELFRAELTPTRTRQLWESSATARNTSDHRPRRLP